MAEQELARTRRFLEPDDRFAAYCLERAVEMFLRGDMKFGRMVDAVLDTMAVTPVKPLDSLEAALEAHQVGAEHVRRSVFATS